MPETRLSGVQKPCSLRAGSMEKRPAPRAAERGRNLLVERFSRFVKSRNGARQSRFWGGGSARGRAVLRRAGKKDGEGRRRTNCGPEQPGNGPASTPEKAPDVRSLCRRSLEGSDAARPRKSAAESPRRALAPSADVARPPPGPAATHGERLPSARDKKSGRIPPPATESGRASSVKTTQMRTT